MNMHSNRRLHWKTKVRVHKMVEIKLLTDVTIAGLFCSPLLRNGLGSKLVDPVWPRVGETVLGGVHSGNIVQLGLKILNSRECFPAGLFSHNPISHRPANKRFSNSSGWSKGVSCCNPNKSKASLHWWREGPSEILELDGTLSTQLYVGAEESWE